MRCCIFLLLLLTIIISCSKKDTERSNFAELMLDGHKFSFDSLEAVVDTSTRGITVNFYIYDRASHSNMVWETLSGSNGVIGTYRYPGESLPGLSLVFMDLQTYLNQVPGTYNVENNSLTLIIDQSGNKRIHGTFSGKMNCYSCTPYGIEANISNGEFEMPYSYR